MTSAIPSTTATATTTTTTTSSLQDAINERRNDRGDDVTAFANDPRAESSGHSSDGEEESAPNGGFFRGETKVQEGELDDERYRQFDAVILIDRAVKTGYEDDLQTFIDNPDLFWVSISNIDQRYLDWSLHAAKRGHLSIVKVLWRLFETRSNQQGDPPRDPPNREGQLRKIVWGAAKHGKMNILNWVWCHSKVDPHTHTRSESFAVGLNAAVRGGSMEALKWFYARNFLVTDACILNDAIKRGFSDIVDWCFSQAMGSSLKVKWYQGHIAWYKQNLAENAIDKNVQLVMVKHGMVYQYQKGWHPFPQSTRKKQQQKTSQTRFRRLAQHHE
jgi:hypothetical protein